MRIYERFRLHIFTRWLRSDIAILVSFWFAGLFLGAYLAPTAADPLFTLVHPVISGRVSVISGLITASLPLLLAAYAVNIHKPKLLFFIIFLKAFHFSFCGGLIYSIFGTAGWMLRLLVQFTDIFTVPVFCWFCIRHSLGRVGLNKKDLIISLSLTLLAASIDYLVIAPFFANLIDI